MLGRPSTNRTLAAISGTLWGWSWYTMYLEIHRWKHVTRSFRFNPPAPIPGTGIRPRPGLPLKALYVCAAGAPPVFLVTVIAGIARTHQRSQSLGKRHYPAARDRGSHWMRYSPRHAHKTSLYPWR